MSTDWGSRSPSACWSSAFELLPVRVDEDRVRVVRGGRGEGVPVEQDAAVGLVGQQVDRAVPLRGLGEDPRQRVQRVRREDPPGGVVRGVEDHGPGPRRDRRAHVLGVKVERRRVDLHPHRLRPRRPDQGLVEEVRRAHDDHLVALAGHRPQHDSESGDGCVRQRDVVGLEVDAELLAERLRHRLLRPRVAPDVREPVPSLRFRPPLEGADILRAGELLRVPRHEVARVVASRRDELFRFDECAEQRREHLDDASDAG